MIHLNTGRLEKRGLPEAFRLKMNEKNNLNIVFDSSEQQMLLDTGYSEKAIFYYTQKPYMGMLPDAEHVSEMKGTCGDTMKIYLKIDQGIIRDARYQVLGCPGAVAAAMAVVDLIKGKNLNEAHAIDDHDVFRTLVDIPSQKHHCIQLAVKTLQKALTDWERKQACATII